MVKLNFRNWRAKAKYEKEWNWLLEQGQKPQRIVEEQLTMMMMTMTMIIVNDQGTDETENTI